MPILSNGGGIPAVSLAAASGLPIWLDRATGLLSDDGAGILPVPGIRRLGDLDAVLRTPLRETDNPNAPAYYLYRDVRTPDAKWPEATGLRYDITVTLTWRHAGERAKTAGHVHLPGQEGRGYPEVYEVLHGSAAFVLQRPGANVAGARADAHSSDHREPVPPSLSGPVGRPLQEESFREAQEDRGAETPEGGASGADPPPRQDPRSDIIVALCGPGERIVIPPPYGHLTVNLGDEPLVVADLVAAHCENDYGAYRLRRGGALYLVHDPGTPAATVVKRNPAYAIFEPVVIRRARADRLPWSAGPLYTAVDADPSQFRFLMESEPRGHLAG